MKRPWLRADFEHCKLIGQVVSYELGKPIELDAIVLNDGLSLGYGRQVTDLSQLALALKRDLVHTRKHTPAVIAVRVPGPMEGTKAM